MNKTLWDGLAVGGALWLLASSVVACAAEKPPAKSTNGQSFEAAMKLVCNVDDHLGVTDDSDPLELDQRRTDFLQNHVKNPDVIYHQVLWRVQANTQRAKTIRDLSCQADLKRCPYADALERGDL